MKDKFYNTQQINTITIYEKRKGDADEQNN